MKICAFFLFLFIAVFPIFSQVYSDTIGRTPEQEVWIKNHLSQAEINWINQDHTVRAKLGNNPPMYFLDNKACGISVDFLTIAARKTGIKFEYSECEKSWNEVLSDFKTNKYFDLLLSLKFTEERKTFIEFTDEYIEMPLVIFTKEDAPFISTIKDISNQIIVVEKGFWIENQLRKEFPDLDIRVRKTTSEALEALAVNQADAYIGNLLVASYIIKNKGYRNLKVAASTPYKHHNQAMGVRKDWPELASILNKVFSEITVEEKNQILNPYFAIRYEHGIQNKDILRYAFITFLVVLLFFSIFLFWNRSLKKEIKRRLEIEKQLKDSELKFKTLSNVSFEGIVFSNKAIIMECNAQVTQLLGYDMCEMIGKKVVDFIAHEWRDAVMQRAISGNEDLYETELLCKDNTLLPVEITARMISYKGQMVRVSVFRDITIAKQAEREREAHRLVIENNNKLLKELDRKKNRFFSIIAHDLKGPIATLSNLTEVLIDQKKSSEPEVKDRILTALHRSSKNTFSLLKNLLQWAKSEMGGLSIEKESLNISLLIDENLELFRENYNLKNIQVHNSVHDDVFVYSDLNITNTIIRNLISNAIKFTYEFGAITIHITKETEDYLDLCIEDNGMGMDKNILKNIFNLDSDYTSLGTKDETGTGLGLKLCKEFVSRVDGELYVTSIEGKGSRFTVRLPRKDKT